MFIIEGNERKITQVWEHIKRHHTGDKIAVVGFGNQLPQTQLRNKQVIFYDNLAKKQWLSQAEAFLQRFEEHYDGIIFYVDCSQEEANRLNEISKNYTPKLTVTVHAEKPGTIQQLV